MTMVMIMMMMLMVIDDGVKVDVNVTADAMVCQMVAAMMMTAVHMILKNDHKP